MIKITLSFRNTDTNAERYTTAEFEPDGFIGLLKNRDGWYKLFESKADIFRRDFVWDAANILEGAAGAFMCPYCEEPDLGDQPKCPRCGMENDANKYRHGEVNYDGD